MKRLRLKRIVDLESVFRYYSKRYISSCGIERCGRRFMVTGSTGLERVGSGLEVALSQSS